MKTYNVVEAVSVHGAFVKTSDHFEAVGELESKLHALRCELDIERQRRINAIAQMSALTEQLSKGVAGAPRYGAGGGGVCVPMPGGAVDSI